MAYKRTMRKKIVIMRGIPGSGKSTYVRENLDGAFICSADNYFEELAELNQTTYLEEFKPWLVGKAHQHCWGSFIHATVIMDEPLVVVDNTNIHHWEYENYVLLGEQMGYEVEVVQIPFDSDKAEVYHRRNTHGVPLEVIQRMINDYQH